MTLDPIDSLFDAPSRAVAVEHLRRLLGRGELTAVRGRIRLLSALPRNGYLVNATN